jgi:hypothetical protein
MCRRLDAHVEVLAEQGQRGMREGEVGVQLDSAAQRCF